MRVKLSNSDISVNAIAGSEVVLFGINVPKNKSAGLLGFKIEKKNKNNWYQLSDGRTFKDSKVKLVQAFMWSDYVVDPGKEYEYRFTASYGTADNLTFTKELSVKVTTENPDDGQDGVFFNRGVAGSQRYSTLFKDYLKYYKKDPAEQDPDKITFKQYLKPEDVPNREAYKWLSRGLEEALLAYINKAKDSSYSIRACLYELSNKPAAEAFIDALERGVDVKILHHAKTQRKYEVDSNSSASITTKYYKNKDRKPEDLINEEDIKSKMVTELREPDAISETAMVTLGSRGITDSKYLNAFKKIFLPRTNVSICHNKFIILLKDGKPIEVWTGSTNLTDGGIYGQSNVGQIMRNEDIAKQYFDYWTQISNDPKGKDARNWIAENNPNLKLKDPANPNAPQDDFPENFVGAIFSPRKDYGMMDWYAERIKEAKNSVFLTSAFSIDKRFAEIFNKDSEFGDKDSFLRYLIVESEGAPYIKIHLPSIRKCDQNRVAWGDKMDDRKGVENDEELAESLTGLNSHVNYLHTKYMIIDPLTDDPIVVSGSANFSEASTNKNDENMLILRGNTRVADIYVTEFMRLFNHFKTRNESNKLSDAAYLKHQHLDPKDTWKNKYYKKGNAEYNERLLFSNESA